MNTPNKLTLSRIILAPIFVIIFLFDDPHCRIAGFVIFVIASLTDLADGHYARKYNIVTGFGKFMDPLADKIMVTTAFIAVVALDCARAWMVALIVAREFYVTGLRSLMAYRGAVLSPSTMAKVKTTVQMISITFILLMITLDSFFALYKSPLQPLLEFNRQPVYDIIIGLATLITLYTGLDYTIKYYHILKNILR